jgi:hypothetical protein
MAFIFDEKYKYADAYNLASINDSILSVTAQLNEATGLYNQSMTAIASCNNSSTGCLEKTGRHISTWRDQRDRYQPLVTQYKAELSELLSLQKQLSGTQADTAGTTVAVAAAETAISKADEAQTKASAAKYLLYGGIALAVIIIGFIAYKMIKRKK